MEPWMIKLKNEIRKVVGEDRADHYETVILPNIVMDFYKMLQGSKADSFVSEEYRMEDNSMKIVLCGLKDSKGQCKVTRSEIKKC